MAKKPWGDIHPRYIAGEPPKSIAEDFPGITPEQITQKAKRDGWKTEKDTIRQETFTSVLDEKKAIRKLTGAGVQFIISDIAVALKEGRLGLNVQDGEGFLNDIYKATWKKALEDYYEEAPTNGPEASRPVYRSIYQTDQPDSTPTRNFASKAILPLEGGDPGSQEWEDDGSD